MSLKHETIINGNKALGITGIIDTKYAPKGVFVDSLDRLLGYIKDDFFNPIGDKKVTGNLTDVREVAYLLATAFVEAGYSLQRWESDFTCSDSKGKNMTGRSYVGTLPGNKPCKAALDYYNSNKGGKANYYTECKKKHPGESCTDPNGLPYFGRGIIQLTWRYNYEKYGKLIGIPELDNMPDAFMENDLYSYRVAVAYMNGGKQYPTGSSSPKYASTFDFVKEGDLTRARKSVNGGTKDIDEVNGAYNAWIGIFQKLAEKRQALGL